MLRSRPHTHPESTPVTPCCRQRLFHPQRGAAPAALRRGLALAELLLAIAITAMITASVASITTAVAHSEEFERDRRESTVRSQALYARLSAYVTPALAALDVQNGAFVLWIDDTRVSTTVHASEVRWVNLDDLTGTIVLYYIEFPAEWTEIQIDEADAELPSNTDWWAALNTYQNLGYISSIRLSDGVADFSISYDPSTLKSKKILTFNVTFAGQVADRMTICSSSIREYQEPTL